MWTKFRLRWNSVFDCQHLPKHAADTEMLAIQDHAAVKKCREGMAMFEDIDPGFCDPETKTSMLMIAAAFGNHSLIHQLCLGRADVNAESRDGASALAYAAECATGKAGRQCLDRLIASGANLHCRSGRTYAARRTSLYCELGVQNPVGNSVCMRAEKHMFDSLRDGKYDFALRNSLGEDSLDAATRLEDTCIVESLLEMKMDHQRVHDSWNVVNDPWWDGAIFLLVWEDYKLLRWGFTPTFRMLGSRGGRTDEKMFFFFLKNDLLDFEARWGSGFPYRFLPMSFSFNTIASVLFFTVKTRLLKPIVIALADAKVEVNGYCGDVHMSIWLTYMDDVELIFTLADLGLDLTRSRVAGYPGSFLDECYFVNSPIAEVMEGYFAEQRTAKVNGYRANLSECH